MRLLPVRQSKRAIRLFAAVWLVVSLLAATTPTPAALAQGQSWTHTTVGDFSGCSTLTNTSVANMAGGEVRLASGLEDYFDAPLIDSTRWITAQIYNYGGAFAPTLDNGVLRINGSYLRSVASMTQPTRIFEARVRLRVPPPNTAWGDIGFGRQNYPGMPDTNGHNRLFITNDANQIFANARNGEDPVNNVLMSGVDPADWHTYRIVWGQSSADYYVDGVYRTTDNQPSSYNPYVWLYTLNPGSTVEVDWIRVDYYPNATGQFVSCAIDGGQTTTWGSFNWTGSVPAGTSLTFETRTSPDGAGWSAWSAPFSASGSPITSPANRYLQYRITFSTGNNTLSPEVAQVTVDLNNPGTPTPTPVTPTATATTPPPPQWTHTSLGDFSGCSLLANTIVANAAGGEVRLVASVEDYFDGPAVNGAIWRSETYSGQNTPPTQSGGILTVNSSAVASNFTDSATTQEVEGRLQFAPNGLSGDFDFGLGYPYLITYQLNALFIIDSNGNLYANNLRDNLGLPRQRTQITGVDVTQYHDYRIAVSPTEINYYVDGVLRVTHAQSTPLINQPVAVWVLAQGPGRPFNAEWVRWNRYPFANGTFQSCAIDAGQSANWSTLAWTGQTPAGASVTVETRTSNDLVNWSAWSAPSAAASFAVTSPAGRYLQYRLTLATGSLQVSPQVDAVTVTASDGPPTTTPTPSNTPTSTPTATSSSTPTATSSPTAGPSPTPTSAATNTPPPTATSTATPSPTATNSPPPTATATPGSARSLQFDGVNDIARTADLPLSTQFTIEAWVNRSLDSGGYQTFLSDATNSYGQVMFSLYVDGGSGDCGPGDQFAYFQANGFSVQCSGVTANVGAWHHVAVTRDAAGTRRFFVDGILRSTQTNSPAPTDSSGVFTFGRAGDYAGEYFAGLIDEVRVSNIALYIANFTPPVTPLASGPNTVGLWHLDEGAGQTFADASGNGRNGTLGTSAGADAADPLWSIDSPVASGGPTPTSTPLPTATNTATPTATNTPLPTATSTATPTATSTPLPTATNTATATNTPTNTPLPTATNTPTPANTPLPTSTSTPTPTAVPPTATPTGTPLPTGTNTPTSVPPTPTPIPATATPTNTPLPTATSTATATNTPTPTPIPPSATPTSTPLPTATSTATATNTPTPTPIPPSATPTNTPAAANFALAFDGANDYAAASQVPATGPLTIEAWIRPAANNADGVIIAGADNNNGWALELNNGRLTFWVSTGSNWRFSRFSSQLSAGQWYHVAATYAGGSARTFVNGAAANASNVGTLTQGPSLRFGGLAGYPFFNGALDEVRISNVVRYSGTFSAPTAPFVSDADTLGLWSFDEGSGQTAVDESTSANAATLGSTPGADANDPTWVAGYVFP